MSAQSVESTAPHPIEEAAAKVGGYKALADLLGLSKSAVWQWKEENREVPIPHCWPIEEATGVSRRQLRPNDWRRIWPELVAKAAQ